MSAVDAPVSLQVGLLGPLRVLVDGTEVEVPGPRRRVVLVLLALAAGRTVRMDDLVDALWPSDPPASARATVHTHVSRLRAHLGPAAGRLETTPGGYRLELDDAGSDVLEVRALLAAARRAARDDPAAALGALRRAHAAWRGPVLADLADVTAVATAVEELTRLRRDVTEALVATAVDAGRAAEVVELAAAAHADDPLHEPAVLLLMRALAATGQAPEALRVGREYRRRLAEETGLDPSAPLGELEREIAAGAAGPPGTSSPSRVPPRPGGRFVGREAQVASLHQLLAEQRLVTVVGTGGVGKTRLALEVVGDDEAATVVLLAPVTDPAALPDALAAALRLDVVQGDVLAACVAVLAARPRLLLVDNCEHVLDAARELIARLLASCPELTVLATSREPLGVPGEHGFRLSPLPLPVHGASPGGPAVAVFLDRAARVRPGAAPSPDDLRMVAEIVRRLDGLPLAIELAASRLSAFSVRELHDRLDRALDLLGAARPSVDARHRTLRATLAWSYELLSPDEQRLFRHLAVFPDGVALDTVEWVAGELGLGGAGSDPGAVLSRLVDASLLDADFAAGSTRYRMLETLRAFGLDRLAAAGEDVEASARLRRWGARLATTLGAELAGENEPEADRTLRRELSNLRAAWRLARRDRTVDDAVAIVHPLFGSIAYRDLLEIRRWAEELADDPRLPSHPLGGGVLAAAAEAAYHRGDLDTAQRLASAGEEIATDDVGRWACAAVLMVVALARGEYAEVVEQSRAAADLPFRPEGHGTAALAAAYAGRLDVARELVADIGPPAASPTIRAWQAYVTGEVENAAGESDTAAVSYRTAIDLAGRSGATFIAGVAQVGLLSVLADTGHVAEALRGYRDVVEYFTRTGNWTHLRPTLRDLARLLHHLGDEETAAFLTAAADDAEPDRIGRPDVLAVARRAIDDRAAATTA